MVSSDPKLVDANSFSGVDLVSWVAAFHILNSLRIFLISAFMGRILIFLWKMTWIG